VHSKEKKRERVKLQVTVQGKERESFCVKMCASFGSSSSSSRIKIGVVKKKNSLVRIQRGTFCLVSSLMVPCAIIRRKRHH